MLHGEEEKPEEWCLAGCEQASLTGQRLALLASEGNNFSCIIFSSLIRSTETADIISQNLPGHYNSHRKLGSDCLSIMVVLQSW
ncbi:serine/threonine-protein phosphatase PGAM5, mitochondrial-like [Pelobates fuscus]|uniref:serine/threonine-protein phosphatase PGAM5, mitochondrial-like n=1 Tax=Pelobates fuscus TaxID=191477 RepID=UPI002FE46FDF